MAVFDGFEEPQANFTRIPNAFLEAMSIIDTIGEMKVVYYILRHTWGFQDESKRITLDEFEHGRKRRDGSRLDNGTGLSRPTIIDGLQRAEAHGFITVETDDRDAARIKKSYSLHMKDLDSRGKESLPLTPSRGKESLPRTEKETSSKKETKRVPPSKPKAGASSKSISAVLRGTLTKSDNEIERSPLAEYIGQQFGSTVPPGQCNKLALGYTEQLPGGKKRKHPSPDELWVSHPLYPQWVEERIEYIKGKPTGSNHAQRGKAVNAVCQYKGNHYAWLEWLARQKQNTANGMAGFVEVERPPA